MTAAVQLYLLPEEEPAPEPVRVLHAAEPEPAGLHRHALERAAHRVRDELRRHGWRELEARRAASTVVLWVEGQPMARRHPVQWISDRLGWPDRVALRCMWSLVAALREHADVLRRGRMPSRLEHSRDPRDREAERTAAHCERVARDLEGRL